MVPVAALTASLAMHWPALLNGVEASYAGTSVGPMRGVGALVGESVQDANSPIAPAMIQLRKNVRFIDMPPSAYVGFFCCALVSSAARASRARDTRCRRP